MRVLYVIDSLMAGGAESSLADVAPGYRDAGIDLWVAFLRDRWDVADRLARSGAHLVPVALDQARLAQLRALTRLVRSLRPDIVHTTLYEADVLGRLAAAVARRPSVTTLASSAYSRDHFANPSIRPYRLRAAQAVDAGTARLSRRFHAVSEATATDMSRRLRIPRDRIEVVPRARDRSRLGIPSDARRTRVRAALGLDPDAPVLLVVARHEYEKGIDVAVAAFAKLLLARPGAVLLVAGRPSRETPLLNRIVGVAGVAPSVRLLGYRDDVPDLMVAADVVLVTSRSEGFPGVVLEAMALARPVVASDIPPVREALDDLAAGLAPVADVDAFAAAIDKALADPDHSQALGRRAQARFDSEFTPATVAARMRAFYESAVRDR